MSSRGRIAAVLPGGGARGAYEVGALSALLPALAERGERPDVIVGTSVGAINAALLASLAHLPARVRLTTLTKEFFMPRFLERDEAEREPPCDLYPWDGVRNVRPFAKLSTSVVEGVY